MPPVELLVSGFECDDASFMSGKRADFMVDGIATAKGKTGRGDLVPSVECWLACFVVCAQEEHGVRLWGTWRACLWRC